MTQHPEPVTATPTNVLSVDALIREIEQEGWAYRLEGQCLMRAPGGVCHFWMYEATVRTADGRGAIREATTVAKALLGAIRGTRAAGGA